MENKNKKLQYIVVLSALLGLLAVIIIIIGRSVKKPFTMPTPNRPDPTAIPGLVTEQPKPHGAVIAEDPIIVAEDRIAADDFDTEITSNQSTIGDEDTVGADGEGVVTSQSNVLGENDTPIG